MQIHEQRVFRFEFPFLGQVATFNVVAESQTEAADKIMKWMSETMVELSVAFPKMKLDEPAKEKPKAMEELRIDTLIADLSKHLALGPDRAATIKEWLKTEYEPNNFPLIIDGLENLKKAYETGKIKKGK